MKIKTGIIPGMMLSGTIGCSTLDQGNHNFSHNSNFAHVDTMSIVHINYGIDCDYINLALINDPDNIKRFVQVTGSTDTIFGEYGDTVLVSRNRRHGRIMDITNISQLKRQHMAHQH